MTSPVQLLPNFNPAGADLFATPNFDEMRDSTDLCYFDNLDGPSFLGEYPPSWDVKERPGEAPIDPFLGGPDLSNANLFAAPQSPLSELTPPPSAVDDAARQSWPSKAGQTPAQLPKSKLPVLDTAQRSQQFARAHGQITPPMSSKSPEFDLVSEESAPPAKRGRKPTAKASAAASKASPPAKTPPSRAAPPKARKARMSKAKAQAAADAEAEEEEDDDGGEPQTEEAKAKRARFLERNRQAAFTCRQRKKLWARDLEDRHRDLERENQNLKLVLVSLRDEFQYLRHQAVSHTTCECTGARDYIQRSSRALAAGGRDRDAAPRPNSSGSQPAAAAAAAPAAGSDGLQHALRHGLAHLDPTLKHEPPELGAGFGVEGAELDGMTL